MEELEDPVGGEVIGFTCACASAIFVYLSFELVDLVLKGPVTQRFTALSRPNHVKKLFPVKQTMLSALMSSLRRAIVDL